MRHTISIRVRNEFGVLSRVVGMFSGRGYNIDSLNVAPTLKLIDVMTVKDHTEGDFVGRELAMIKVAPPPEARAEVLRITEIFRGKIVDVDAKSFVIELTGGPEKIDAICRLLESLGIRELVRTGPLAVARGG
jgi:acetolactate synthase-1/3 small subunit